MLNNKSLVVPLGDLFQPLLHRKAEHALPTSFSRRRAKYEHLDEMHRNFESNFRNFRSRCEHDLVYVSIDFSGGIFAYNRPVVVHPEYTAWDIPDRYRNKGADLLALGQIYTMNYWEHNREFVDAMMVCNLQEIEEYMNWAFNECEYEEFR